MNTEDNAGASENAIAKPDEEHELVNVALSTENGSQIRTEICDHGDTECGNKPRVPRGEEWESIADAFNWFTEALFEVLNMLLFIKYIYPLFLWQLANSYLANYLIDTVALQKLEQKRLWSNSDCHIGLC